MAGTRVLFDKVYFISHTGVNRGYVFVEDDVVKDCGEEAPAEYGLSELVYERDYDAVIVHGYSVAITPSKYILRGLDTNMDLSILTRDELRECIKAALYELQINGVTLPIIYNEPEKDLVIDVAKSIELPVVIMDRDDVIKNCLNKIDNRFIYGISVGRGLNGLKAVREDEVCTPYNIGGSCKIIYLDRNYNLHAQISLIEYFVGRSKLLELLTNPYRILGIDHGIVEKGAKADLVMYLCDMVPKAPIPPLKPETPLFLGYHPDIIMVRGDVIIERGESYIINPGEVSNVLKGVKWSKT